MAKAKDKPKKNRDWLKMAAAVRDSVEQGSFCVTAPSDLTVGPTADGDDGSFLVSPRFGAQTVMDIDEFKDITRIGLAMWPELAKE